MTDWQYKTPVKVQIPQLYITDHELWISVWKEDKKWNRDDKSWRIRYGYKVEEALFPMTDAYIILEGNDLRSPALYSVAWEPFETPRDMVQTLCAFLANDGEHFAIRAGIGHERCPGDLCMRYTAAQHDWLVENYERLAAFAVDDTLDAQQ